MESLFSTICENATWAPEILFLLLLIAGLNFPISEDIILITGGAITALCIPEHHFRMYAFVFLGCWMSAWESYALGRFLGPKLYQIKWFNHWINPKIVSDIHEKIEHYGLFTFFVIRFIPGGVRNTFFMTCGLGKMPFKSFIFRDGLAVLFSSSVIFHIGFEFAEHYDEVIKMVQRYQEYFILAILSILAIVATVLFIKQKRS